MPTHLSLSCLNTVATIQVAMEAELVAVTRQVTLLKEGYSKGRDNLRAEQSVRRTTTTCISCVVSAYGIESEARVRVPAVRHCPIFSSSVVS